MNISYCISGTNHRYFGHVLPTFEDYIPFDEELIPPPVVDLRGLCDLND